MLTLQRITSEYVATEDRFRLSGVTDQGGEVAYWMTQRLLLRLLDFLLDWLETHREELERQAAAAMLGPLAAKPAQRAGAEASSTANEAGAQGDQASEAGKKEPPEEDKAATAELLFEADIRIAAARVTIVFKPRNSEHAQLSLLLEEAWQWIAIIHTLWKRAEWNLSCWPDWIEQVKTPHAANSQAYLH